MRPFAVLAFAFAVFLLVSAPGTSRAESPATLFHGGIVFTGQSAKPDATWFVVRDGRFVAVGDGEVPADFASLARIDLRGRFVAPGFVDAHVHFIDGGLSLLQTDVSAAGTLADLARAIERAKERPVGGFVVLRNLGFEPTSGALPSHSALAKALEGLGDQPLVIALKGGHHVYVNPAGLKKLGIDAKTPDPRGGRIVRDDNGQPTGVLVDQAAWDVMRSVTGAMSAEEVSRAILAAQRLALSYGVTAIGDNTFAPSHLAKMAELAKGGHLRLRVTSRSFGPVPVTKMLMKSMGGDDDPRIRFFGDKFFVDRSLSGAGAKLANDTGDAVAYGQDELEEIFRFAGRYGLAFHTQTREGAERLVRARMAVKNRRAKALFPDIIDHCGSCSGDIIGKIRDAGFAITTLPGQLHDLPSLVRDLGEDEARKLLPLRELFDSGLEPALTSDWPYGVETSYPEIPDSFHRIGFAPLANIAVAVSAKDPLGRALAHADTRTITLSQALHGYGPWAAKLVGRGEDLGRIAQGRLADFVVLPRSPFEIDTTELYEMPVVATYVSGEKVFDAAIPKESEREIEAVASEHDGMPWGLALSPIFGYDPTPGFLLGGAAFVFPYRESGVLASAQLIVPPQQGTLQLDADFAYLNALPSLSPRMAAGVDTMRSRYYGFGMGTSAGDYLLTRPVHLSASVGVTFHAGADIDVTTSGLYGYLRDGEREAIENTSSGREGIFEGSYAGGRLEISHDTRDETFSARRGGKESLWAELWGIQGNANEPRGRIGISASRFLPLYAPDFILALRLEGGLAFGERAYLTSFSLGGANLLRGHLANRFRGDAFAAGTTELRFPIWSFISGATFADAGRVFVGKENDAGPPIAITSGFGLRFGLPPDGLVKLRFDAGFAKDEWGIFFKFGEAF